MKKKYIICIFLLTKNLMASDINYYFNISNSNIKINYIEEWIGNINRYTGTMYDREGYDIEGFDINGLGKENCDLNVPQYGAVIEYWSCNNNIGNQWTYINYSGSYNEDGTLFIFNSNNQILRVENYIYYLNQNTTYNFYTSGIDLCQNHHANPNGDGVFNMYINPLCRKEIK